MSDEKTSGIGSTAGDFSQGWGFAVVPAMLAASPFGRSGIHAGMSAMTAGVRGWLAWQEEIAGFAFRRLEKSADFGRQLLDAADTAERRKAQTEYVQDLASDCWNEAQQLVRRGTEVACEIATIANASRDAVAGTSEAAPRPFPVHPLRRDAAAS